MKLLAIETSCDETAFAVLEAKGGLKSPKLKVIQNLVASQIKIHRPFGGVVPNLAKREHIKNLPILFKKIGDVEDMDVIAVTVGPGLEPALWTGITFAKEIAKKYKKPLLGANHLEGHLYSFLLPSQKSKNPKRDRMFPAIGLVVSGGHTILLKMDSLTKWSKIGETRDDAVGEAYDKVARMLKLPYPGGPEVEKLAKSGNPDAINFPRPMIHHKNYDFSFSGIKTSVLYYLRDNPDCKPADVAASFQKAAVEVLVAKAMRAAREYSAKSVILAGGVAANKFLRKSLEKETSKTGIKLFVPDFDFNTDNAAMIGAAAYINVLKKKRYKLVARGNMNI
ncbi:MAG: tRNA (adenosine(37)-N6)-threonylcarbamoyltransferase complex transferase subunit TsaD [Candidatus Colwellbacteria bacterium]|nr:tRNA (adenosine(37)-N6)-threonylcarbamoyltransferase complex transferase subunit TsaD [Candidatus Colwellbacteria bacterium]